MAQKAEIGRQAKQLELYQAQEEKEQELKEALAQQVILSEFERSQMGVLSKTKNTRSAADAKIPDTPIVQAGVVSSSSTSSPSTPSSANKDSKKRAFELDEGSLERMSKQERQDVAKAIDAEVTNRCSFDA